MVAGIALCLCSCTRQDCMATWQNEILGTHPYNSPAYQAELYTLIRKHPDVHYYFEKREEIGGQSYLVVNAYGDAFCGKLQLAVREDDRKSIKLQSLKGYRGAQLVGLRFARNTTALGEALVYQSLEYIVD